MKARQKLLEYSWPGNVRELKHTMERAAILGEGSQLGAGDLRLPGLEEHSSNVSLRLDDVERQTIVRVLDRCRGNHTQAAKMLDISRTTLYTKLKKYGL